MSSTSKPNNYLRIPILGTKIRGGFLFGISYSIPISWPKTTNSLYLFIYLDSLALVDTLLYFLQQKEGIFAVSISEHDQTSKSHMD